MTISDERLAEMLNVIGDPVEQLSISLPSTDLHRALTELQSLRAIPRGGVKVKGLEWHSDKFGHVAESLFGTWWVRNPFSDGRVQLEGPFGHSMHKCAEEAKAAAQADYERRILSALVYNESPVGEAQVGLPVASETQCAIEQEQEPSGWLINFSDGSLEFAFTEEDIEDRIADMKEGEATWKPLYLSPSDCEGKVTEEMIERAYEAFVAACEWSDWDEPEVRGYLRTALTAALQEGV